ncbi:GNAT family N-acetyltransferase [Pseudobacteriovorax antillogorgiicola]|uniref:Acetyltransferase (GNAT) domain-containing protein n=1 Tax=Pseudobacteriovorax antillogorgiicola TaxID=1513793 RepID=A0A1Y6BHZ4_9BACT|nr:GNAT family N-acetyltransferase [Pseudobacteriovorax antillogorgiicola]TCS55434.1 acetyltransferase (GNAT) family protein [Pseudobacteriovorax antillogorgiicola]SMF12483.1 Acetyltransferase (GNAT) domain-containing protein [Pseudobacteriovorax antillogorgiicola]
MESFKTFTLHWDKMSSSIKYQVLSVRCRAYQKVGKFSSEKRPMDVVDVFDRQSSFPMVLYKGRVVATMRIINHRGDQCLEHDFAGPKLRALVSQPCLEITRVCVDPDFSRLGLTNLLFQEAAQAIVDLAFQSKKFTVIGSCTEELIPFYQKVGCELIGLEYTHPELGNRPHHIFIADTKKLMMGHMNFFVFAAVAAKAALRAKQLHGYRKICPKLNLALLAHYPLLFSLRLRSLIALKIRQWRRLTKALPHRRQARLALGQS